MTAIQVISSTNDTHTHCTTSHWSNKFCDIC